MFNATSTRDTAEDLDRPRDEQPDTQASKKKVRLTASLGNYVLLGAAATLLLSLVELIDVHFQLTPVFQSFLERVIFSTYFSLNLLSGLLTGAALWLYVQVTSFLYRSIEKLLLMRIKFGFARKLVAGLGVSALSAAVLLQAPPVYRYILGLMIEAQKLPYLYGHLLERKQIVSYFILLGLVISCSIVFMLSRAAGRMPRPVRVVWIVCLLLLIIFGYYVDSRFEVGLYGNSLHSSMFLLSKTATMAFIASIYFSSPGFQIVTKLDSRFAKRAAIAAIAVLIILVGLTFVGFDKNHNLKTQIFARTTQASKYFKMAHWLLDFDRDGYSAFLGGGDSNDRRADIHPERVETIGDGIDNNGLAGDLSPQAIEDWKLARTKLNTAASPQSKRYNIIYFFIDAVRADHLGAYGYHRQTSPNIDRLAERSSVFEHAYSPSANTFESTPRFMQASYWDAHLETWTEVLARNGYNALLFPARRLPMLRRYVKGVKVVEEARGANAKQTVAVAIDVLSKAPAHQPFLAYIYVAEPHSPYRRHEDFNFGSSLHDRYDAEIAYTDHQMGILFDWMQKAGRFDDTIVVIMTDHGESLGERMVYRHSSQLYNEQTHIPMIIYVPNLAPRRIADYVSSIDLGPTILNALGLDGPKDYVGVSLLPAMRGEPHTHPPIYGEERYKAIEFANLRPEEDPQTVDAKYMVITQDGYKLIYNRNFNGFELFDLKRDRAEQNNLYNREPEKAGEMARLLGRFIDIVTASRPWDADESKYALGRDENKDEQLRHKWKESEP